MKLFSWAPGPEDTLESDPHEWAEYNLPADLHSAVRHNEHKIILATLAATSSRNEAAQRLGISPRTLRYKLARWRELGRHAGDGAQCGDRRPRRDLHADRRGELPERDDDSERGGGQSHADDQCNPDGQCDHCGPSPLNFHPFRRQCQRARHFCLDRWDGDALRRRGLFGHLHPDGC